MTYPVSDIWSQSQFSVMLVISFNFCEGDLYMEPTNTTPPAAQPPVASTGSNGLAITALVVGIVAFCLGWTGPFGLVLALVAIVFGILALVKKQSKGMGIAGLVLGGIALITALIVTSLGAALLGGAAQVANDVSNEQKALDSVKKDFAKGDTAKFDKLDVKVTTVTQNWQPTDGFSKPDDGKEFVLVSLDIKNTSSETVSVNPLDFKIDDAGVAEIYELTTTSTPLNAVELKPGSSVTGDIVFQAKKDATGLKLQYKTFSTSAFKEVTYTIAL